MRGLAALLLAGCNELIGIGPPGFVSPDGGSYPGPIDAPPPAILELATIKHDFGYQTFGTTSAALSVTMRNVGGTPTGAVMMPFGDARFPLDNTCAGTSIAPGATCTFSVQFRPPFVGTFRANLTWAAEPGGRTSLELDGVGVTQVNVTTTGNGIVTSSPVGIDCGAACSLPFGTVVTLTATPDAGQQFVGWSGACSGTGTCAPPLSIPASSIGAAFTPL